MSGFVSYSTNHSRPWMDLVVDHGIDEAEAKLLFDRMEPLKSFDERRIVWREAIAAARAHVERRKRLTAKMETVA